MRPSAHRNILSGTRALLMLVCSTSHGFPSETLPTARASGASSRIFFRYPGGLGLAGVLNTATAFRDACLRQDWSEDLPERLVPEGYRVVSRDIYWWGKDEGALPRAAILSRTGSEDGDKAGGFPTVDMMPKTDKMPRGSCTATWNGGWPGGAAATRRTEAVDLAAMTPLQVAYVLQATPAEQPADAVRIEDRQAGRLNLASDCFSGRCGIRTAWEFGPETFSLTLERIELPAPAAPQ